jgi:hypothetical protein
MPVQEVGKAQFEYQTPCTKSLTFKFRQDHCRIADFASNLGGSADLCTAIHPPPLTLSPIFRWEGIDVSFERDNLSCLTRPKSQQYKH